MAAAFRAHTTANITGAASDITCDKPSGVIQGDGLIAIVRCTDPAVTITPPSGWTLEDTETLSAVGRVSVYSKVATGSEGSAYVFTLTGHGVGDRTFVSISAFSGTDIFDLVSGISSTANSASTPTTPGLTPTRANSIIIISAATTGNSNAGSYALATSSPSFTEIYDTWDNIIDGYPDIAAAYGIRPETTATGTATASSGSENITHLIILNPAADVTITPPTFSGELYLFMFPDIITHTLSITAELLSHLRERFSPKSKSDTDWSNQSKS